MPKVRTVQFDSAQRAGQSCPSILVFSSIWTMLRAFWAKASDWNTLDFRNLTSLQTNNQH